MNILRVLLVDDHPVILCGLEGMLSTIDGIEVVGQADTGQQALAEVERLRPDALLMDVRLPDINGLEVTRRVKEMFPEVLVVLITVSDSDLYLLEALRWGANGYLAKDSSRDLIAHALRTAALGGTVISSSFLGRSFSALARPATTEDPDEEPPLVDLTPRELDVLRHLSLGKSNKDIGQELCVAEVTVKKYVQSILLKLGVRDRTQAALSGVRLGLLK